MEIVRVAPRVPSAATNVARMRWNGACLRTVRTTALPVAVQAAGPGLLVRVGGSDRGGRAEAVALRLASETVG